MRSPWTWCREQLLRRIHTLRFPYLLALTASLFVIDLVVPDMIPWVDEMLLGLGTLLLARLRHPPLPDAAPEQRNART